MVFSSPIFLFVFLPLVLSIYYLLPKSARNSLLVIASLVFYAWGEPTFLPIMLASILATYVFGLQAHDKRFLLGGIAANLLLLCTFKYGGFLLENLWLPVFIICALALGLLPRYWRLLGIIAALVVLSIGTLVLGKMSVPDLPLGISFFTFQAMSYLIDVHRGVAKPARNPLRVALYISLFSQLVAGPILRYADIAPQIHSRRIDIESLAYGARRFVVGLGKKVLIADTLAVAADAIFDLGHPTMLTAWTGAICYGLQIYFDFSGYSDMAIGLGHLFGFKFMENFNFPYAAKSIRDFWRRWHISLSGWFRDYLYIPLGGSRAGMRRTYSNLVIVFLLCGLWHGASWTFAAWGAWHGLWLVAERRGLRMSRLLTLLVVLFGWVLFRSETFSEAASYAGAMVGVQAGAGTFALNTHMIAAMAIGIIGSTPFPLRLLEVLERYPGFAYARIAAMALILIACAAGLMADAYSPFIYFRF